MQIKLVVVVVVVVDDSGKLHGIPGIMSV